MDSRHLLVVAAIAAVLAAGAYALRIESRRDYVAQQRGMAEGHAVTVDDARNVLVLRRPGGAVSAHSLERMMMLSLDTLPAAERTDGRDLMGWFVGTDAGFLIPYHAVTPDRMLQWMAPRLPGLNLAHARALIEQYESDPGEVGCVLWVSPRYREVMGPVPPPVGCSRADERD